MFMKNPNMASAEWDRLRTHALALLLVTAAVAAKVFLGVTAESATFVLSGAAVAFSTATGGLPAGVVATLTAVVLARAINHASPVVSGLFALEGFLISVVVIRLAAVAEEHAQEVDAAEARMLGADGTAAGAVHHALNDVVVARGALARVVRMDVAIGPSHLATFIADGLVVSSPTGSTGYSFSAGGPVVAPDSRNLIVTPIAGYLSAIRSVVVGPDQIVRCRIVDATEAIVSIDGREDVPIAVGDVIEVRALERPIHLVEPAGSQPFWDLFRRKVELLPS